MKATIYHASLENTTQELGRIKGGIHVASSKGKVCIVVVTRLISDTVMQWRLRLGKQLKGRPEIIMDLWCDTVQTPYDRTSCLAKSLCIQVNHLINLLRKCSIPVLVFGSVIRRRMSRKRCVNESVKATVLI